MWGRDGWASVHQRSGDSQCGQHRSLSLLPTAPAALPRPLPVSGGSSSTIARAASIPANRTAAARSRTSSTSSSSCRRTARSTTTTAPLRGVRGFGDPHPRLLPNGKPAWHQLEGARRAAAVPPDRRRPRRRLPRRPRRTRGLTGTRRSTTACSDHWVAAKGTATMAYLEPAEDTVPLRARRRVHDLRRLPLLVHRQHRPQPLLPVDRLDRQRRSRAAGPCSYNDELGYDWMTYPERLESGRRLVEGVPGHRLRPERRRLVGMGQRRLHRQLRRHVPAVLQLLPQRRSPAIPLYEKARAGTDATRPGRTTSRSSPPTCAAGKPAAGELHHGARGVQRTLELADQLRRLVHRQGPRRPQPSNPGRGARPSSSSPTTRTTGSSTTFVPPHPNTPLYPGRPRRCPTEHECPTTARDYEPLAGPLRASARASRCSPCRRGAPAAGSCSETFDHTSIIRFMEQSLRHRRAADHTVASRCRPATPRRRSTAASAAQGRRCRRARDAYAPTDRAAALHVPPLWPPADGRDAPPEPGIRPGKPDRLRARGRGVGRRRSDHRSRS